jgi:predicted small secreted protein
MKLIISKDENDELLIKIAKGTIEEEFSYVKMLKELLNNNKFEETIYKEGVTEPEKERIESMLKQINELIEDESDNTESAN